MDKFPNEKPKINLDRNVPVELIGRGGEKFEFNPDHFYRMIGKTGYADLMEKQAIAPNTLKSEKKQYAEIYFHKGWPLWRYANHRDDIDYFIELKPTENVDMLEVEKGYPKLTEKYSIDDVEIRVYEIDNKTKLTKCVFDNFSE